MKLVIKTKDLVPGKVTKIERNVYVLKRPSGLTEIYIMHADEIEITVEIL